MYIILYGSIAVIKTTMTDQGPQDNLVLCLYDGQHFGELCYFQILYFFTFLKAISGTKDIDNITDIHTV